MTLESECKASSAPDSAEAHDMSMSLATVLNLQHESGDPDTEV